MRLAVTRNYGFDNSLEHTARSYRGYLARVGVGPHGYRHFPDFVTFLLPENVPIEYQSVGV